MVAAGQVRQETHLEAAVQTDRPAGAKVSNTLKATHFLGSLSIHITGGGRCR